MKTKGPIVVYCMPIIPIQSLILEHCERSELYVYF